MDGGKERGTEGGTGGRAGGVGRDGSQKTRTPHRDVGKNPLSAISIRLLRMLLKDAVHLGTSVLRKQRPTLRIARATYPRDVSWGRELTTGSCHLISTS